MSDSHPLETGSQWDVFNSGCPTRRSLCELVSSICGWAEANMDQVQAARDAFDRQGTGSGQV
jgi:hypothetical protein